MAKQQWKSITRAGAALALGAVLSWGFWLLGSLSLGQSLVMAFVLGGLFGLLWFMARRTAPARPVSSSIQRLIDGVLLFLFLRYIGQFPVGQSLVLTVVIGYLYLLLLSQSAKPHFEPFWISVQPKWYEILRDQAVIEGAEEWQAISAALRNKPTWKYDVLRSGMRFTFLDSANPFKALIHQPDVPDIYRGVCFCAPIDSKLMYAVLAKLRMPTPIALTHLYIKCGRHGYDLGLARGHELVKLASLPYGELSGYDGINWEELSPGRQERLWGKLVASRKNLLEQNGWKAESMGDARPRSGRYSYLEHKYFNVAHGWLGQFYAVSPAEREIRVNS